MFFIPKQQSWRLHTARICFATRTKNVWLNIFRPLLNFNRTAHLIRIKWILFFNNESWWYMIKKRKNIVLGEFFFSSMLLMLSLAVMWTDLHNWTFVPIITVMYCVLLVLELLCFSYGYMKLCFCSLITNLFKNICNRSLGSLGSNFDENLMETYTGSQIE